MNMVDRIREHDDGPAILYEAADALELLAAECRAWREVFPERYWNTASNASVLTSAIKATNAHRAAAELVKEKA